MSSQYEGPRLAPRPERRAEYDKKLDIAVVIPSYNEDTAILDTIASIADQRRGGKIHVEHGIVVVINNRADASPEIIASNMRTYTLLQGIAHGRHVTIRGNPDAEQKIRRIQESRIPLYIIDSFSPGHAHHDGNVGHARDTGTSHAVSKLVKSADSIIVSTDADTIMGPDAIASLQLAFEQEEMDATSLRSLNNTDGLDASSKRAFENYALYWGVLSAATTLPRRTESLASNSFALDDTPYFTEERAIWLAGASSAFKASAYKAAGGYEPIPGEEDTRIGHRIVEAGLTLKDVTTRYPGLAVYTKPRISLRTSTGYGRTIAQWDESQKSFGNVEVKSLDAAQKANAFLHTFDELRALEDNFDPDDTRDPRDVFFQRCKEFDLDDTFSQELRTVYEAWSEDNDQHHHQFLKKVYDYFDKKYPPIPLSQLVMLTENESAKYSEALRSSRSRPTTPETGNNEYPSAMPWNWERFRESCFSLAHAFGINSEGDTGIKLSAIVIASYDHYVRELQTAHEQKMLANFISRRGRMDGVEESNEERAKRARRVARNATILEMAGSLNARIDFLEHCLQVFSDVLPPEIQSAVDAQIASAEREYETYIVRQNVLADEAEERENAS